MPQIIVTADHGEDAPVLLRERINPSDFESELFGRHLVERLGWAVEDASECEPEPQLATGGPQPPASVVTTAS